MKCKLCDSAQQRLDAKCFDMGRIRASFELLLIDDDDDDDVSKRVHKARWARAKSHSVPPLQEHLSGFDAGAASFELFHLKLLHHHRQSTGQIGKFSS